MKIKENKFLKLIMINAILLASSVSINAQSILTDYNNNTLTKYTLATPDVYSFEKYNLSNINHYVGKPEISVPIYTIKTGNIVYPINLGYNAGGIKVDQLASDVGLGWTLTSSFITRTINGDNDFDNLGSILLQPDHGTYSSTDLLKDSDASYPGNVLHAVPKIGYFLEKQINHKIDHNNILIDFIPDTYHFYANGYSTSFFFNDMNTPVEINPKGTKIQATASKIRIDSQRGTYNLTPGSGFQAKYNFLTQDFFTIVITTNEGIRYTFSDCDYSINQQFNTHDLLYESPAQISAWHITKIEDLITGKKIDFIYDTTSSNPNGPSMPNGYNPLLSQRSFEYISNNLGNSNDSSPYCFYYSSPLYNYNIITNARVDVQKKRLKQIVFDEGEIDFNYNNIGIAGQPTIVRNDLYNGDCVTQIYLKDKNLNTVKSFNFNYDYFTSNYNLGEFNPDNIQNSYRYNRLKLLSFGESGKPLYQFSYNETVKLPPINSFSIDFLGYYNGSTDIATPVALSGSKPNPTLYYYPNNFEKSLLPFPVPNVVPATILTGIFNRQSNANYAQAWSLNQITYPLGSSSQYNYESNQFEVFGQDVNGGGLRIANQVLNDGLGGSRTINYSYKKDTTTTTSGTLASFPFFGHSTFQFFSVSLESQSDPHTVIIPNTLDPYFSTPVGPISDLTHWRVFDKSNLNEDITSGAYVGYSRVVEREIGKGSKELKFTANEPGFKNEIMRITSGASNANAIYQLGGDWNGGGCMGDFIIANSAMGNNIFTDNSYKRGKLLEENIYNESDQPLKKTLISYSENLLNTYSFQCGVTYPVYTQDPEAGLSSLFNSRKDFKIAQYLPYTKTTTTFDALGIQNDEITNFTYNPYGFLITKEDIVSNGDSNKALYFYPQDTQMASEPFMSSLITNNIIATPLDKHFFRNTEKIAEEKIVYANDATTNNLPQPKYVYAKKGTDLNSTLEKKITYDLYDDKGNLVQYTLADGTPVTLVWGYNKTLLIAKIENATYSSVTSLITTAQTTSNTGTEAALITALNNLRSSTLLASAFVTTYTHIPLKGISTVTDPKGYIMYYYYDSYGRLITVKDAAKNIVKENQYNYKP